MQPTIGRQFQAWLNAEDRIMKGGSIMQKAKESNLIKRLLSEKMVYRAVMKHSKYEKHMALCKQLNHTYEVKNIAYGDSFSNSIARYGLVAACIRIGDKHDRMNALVAGARNDVEDESLRDTLLDMANYCIMTVLAMDEMEVK